MGYKNWSSYLRRKIRTSKDEFNFVNKQLDDIVDWGNGKSYKFDGKRWKKVEEQDELEIAVTDVPDEVSTDVLPSAKALSDFKATAEAANAAAEAKAAADLLASETAAATAAVAAKQIADAALAAAEAKAAADLAAAKSASDAAIAAAEAKAANELATATATTNAAVNNIVAAINLGDSVVSDALEEHILLGL